MAETTNAPQFPEDTARFHSPTSIDVGCGRVREFQAMEAIVSPPGLSTPDLPHPFPFLAGGIEVTPQVPS